MDWNHTLAAVWRRKKSYLHGVNNVDPITLDRLVGINEQKQRLIENTELFLAGKKSNNALLWGSRGTGKSSLIKAMLNTYAKQGLRIIEIDKEDMVDLPDIVDDIREVDKHFIVYCDDLSFESGETNYKSLKRVLDGSIELPPENMLIYATSNRRHLMPEFMKDNIGTKLVGDELHYTDSVEEKIALSDRFGLWISFYPISMQDYLTVVDAYFSGIDVDTTDLHQAASDFAAMRGVHSGRTAKQFFNQYKFESR